MQARALEVFAVLLTSLPHQQADTLLSSCAHNDDSDDDSDNDSESAVIEEMWSAAVGILSQVVIHNPEGSKQILQVQHCTSSTTFSFACHYSNVSNTKSTHVKRWLLHFLPI